MSSRRRGFTLVELMVVVVIFSIIAALALISIGRTSRYEALDGFAREVSSALATARRRAVSTRNIYLVSLVQNANPGVPTWSLAWCQVTPDPDQITDAVKTALPTICPSPPAPWQEASRPMVTRPGAEVVQWAAEVDLGKAEVAKLPLPARLYFFPDGTVRVDPMQPNPQGFTVYLQGSSQGAGESNAKRKIFLFPFGGRPRVIDRW